jgi:hypothetical protein
MDDNLEHCTALQINIICEGLTAIGFVYIPKVCEMPTSVEAKIVGTP